MALNQFNWNRVFNGNSPDWDVILDEKNFQKILVIERKRSERSGKPFVLVCIDISRLIGETGQLDPVLRDSIFASLQSAYREIDVVGWQSENATIGVLLTELGDSTSDQVREIVHRKSIEALKKQLPIQISVKITVTVYCFPEDFGDEVPTQVRKTVYPDLIGSGVDHKVGKVLKRMLDVFGSLGLIIVGSPIILVLAFLVRWTSKGPILFRQTRLGQYGKPFKFLKFRSMFVDSDHSIHEKYIDDFIKNGKVGGQGSKGNPVFKLVTDPRVTPIGRFLRKTSLDELPQFFNVLKGDMSLVGPRPPIPYELKRYDLWHRRRILETKPGITGIWQVHGRSKTTFDEMVRMDLEYARNRSIWMDIILLLKTPMAVLKGDGAV
jgi:lipopolysaccharide/colanic/teichoic acid biosynthesis glycosyltransferase